MIQFVPAKRQAIKLLVGVAGGTGSGKTYSALRLARGLAGDAPFALIDTENGRALHYADEFAFEHASFAPPFSPARYLEHVKAAERYPVIVVDSASHEHAGEGGILDMADAELERMGGRDSAKMASWIKPKAEHKAFVRELLRLDAHVILAFRAEPKVEMRKDAGGRWEVVPKPTLTGLDGWIPIAEKNLPFELTCSFLLMPDAPGVPRPIKLPGALRPLVPLDAPLSEDVGAALGRWAAGDDSPAASEPPAPPEALLTAAQRKALDAIAGPMLDADQLDVTSLWGATAMMRGLSHSSVLIQQLDGREEGTGRLRWSPLRDSLTQSEASAMIERLSNYKRRLEEVSA